MDIKTEPDDEFNCSETSDNIYNGTNDSNMDALTNEGQSTAYKYDVPLKQEDFGFTHGSEDFSRDTPKPEVDTRWQNRKEPLSSKTFHPMVVEKFDIGECSYAKWKPNQFPLTDAEDKNQKNRVLWNTLAGQGDGPHVEIEIEKPDPENDISNPESVAKAVMDKCSSHEPDFVCSGCIDTTASHRSLKGHATVHREVKYSNEPSTFVECLNGSEEKPFKCDKCEFKSAYLYKIKNHSMSHSGEKPFKCDQCDFKSAYSYNLKTHKMSHAGEMPFKCEQCDFKSTKFYYLKRHQLSHTGEKPFQCELCDFRSARAFDLKTHKMLHTGEKPYKCDQCDFKATQSSNLRKHKMSHTGEKPFQCDECDYKSTDSRCLRRHKVTHTKQNLLKGDSVIKREKKSPAS